MKSITTFLIIVAAVGETLGQTAQIGLTKEDSSTGIYALDSTPLLQRQFEDTAAYFGSHADHDKRPNSPERANGISASETAAHGG